jgi:hypothetical protein
VFAPAARYRLAGRLRVPTGVTLRGSWDGVPSRETGTVLLMTQGAGNENGTPFITMENTYEISQKERAPEWFRARVFV